MEVRADDQLVEESGVGPEEEARANDQAIKEAPLPLQGFIKVPPETIDSGSRGDTNGGVSASTEAFD